MAFLLSGRPDVGPGPGPPGGRPLLLAGRDRRPHFARPGHPGQYGDLLLHRSPLLCATGRRYVALYGCAVLRQRVLPAAGSHGLGVHAGIYVPAQHHFLWRAGSVSSVGAISVERQRRGGAETGRDGWRGVRGSVRPPWRFGGGGIGRPTARHRCLHRSDLYAYDAPRTEPLDRPQTVDLGATGYPVVSGERTR